MVHTINIPIILTLIRLIFSPFLLPLLLVHFLPFNIFWINAILALFFVMVCLTDFFDGYLARKYKQETVLGKLLDPIADKFLLYSTLIVLLSVHKIFFYWPSILIGREFLVMGIRLIAMEYAISVPVSYLGKIKSDVHMVCLTWIILNPYQELGLSGALWWNGLELVLLILSVILSVVSVWRYYQNFITHFRKRQIQKAG